jgi:putative oxidoreductase
MDLGRLTARVVIGGLFVGHGTQKLFGWFGGPGMAGTEQMMRALQLQPARANAYAAGLTETLGGAMLAAGAFTPAPAAGLIGTMITAIRKVHAPNGPWAAQGGWEYNAVLIATLLALADSGPGDLSVDALLGTERTGPQWAGAALGVGALSSLAVVALGGRGAQKAVDAGPAPYGDVADATGEVAGDPVTAVSDRG